MPYAFGAIVRRQFNVNHLDIWVEFYQPMEQYLRPLGEPPYDPLTPPLAKWLLECDLIPLSVVSQVWQDEHTLLLTTAEILANPDKVTLEYAGPNPGLMTTWEKQWEPFGPIAPLEGWPTTFKAGMIILWSGSVVSIPSGWRLCDGAQGTPNLRDRFVLGAGSTYPVGSSGGNLTHTHAATQAPHYHDLMTPGAILPTGNVWQPMTTTVTPAITVPSTNHLPPYYALCYIMKL